LKLSRANYLIVFVGLTFYSISGYAGDGLSKCEYRGVNSDEGSIIKMEGTKMQCRDGSYEQAQESKKKPKGTYTAWPQYQIVKWRLFISKAPTKKK